MAEGDEVKVAVVCRFRPENARESNLDKPPPEFHIKFPDEQSIQIWNPKLRQDDPYAFDRVFPPSSTSDQEDVYKVTGYQAIRYATNVALWSFVLPTLRHCLKGNNGCIFAYGTN